MEIINASAMISINETFFVQLISFLIFLFVLNRVMVRPLISTMNQRKTYLSNVKTDIEKAKSDLESLQRDMVLKHSRVLAEADDQIHQLGEEAEKRASELNEAARSQISQLRQETEARVKEQISAIKRQLPGEVDALTTLIMEKVLHRRLQS